MNCFGTCFTHVQINCDVTCAQRRNALLRYILYTLYIRPATRGGVGWGAMTCTVLAHIFDATQLYLRTCPMLRNCTCAIALGHMFDATQLHLGTCSIALGHIHVGLQFLNFLFTHFNPTFWTLACEPAFVQATVPQTLSKGVLKKCETN